MKSDFEYNRWDVKLILAITIICFFSIVESRAVHEVDSVVDSSHNLCVTEDCNSTASSILNNMNNTVKPCDNFYLFACGKFKKDWDSSFKLASQKVIERMESMIMEKDTENDSRSFKIVKTLFKSCKDHDHIKGVQDLKRKFLNYTEKLGGWPVLQGDNWNEQNFDWVQYIDEFYKLGYIENSLIFFDVTLNIKNTSQNLILLNQAIPGFSITALTQGLNSSDLKHYYDEMVKFAVELGANKTSALEELKNTFQFNVELAKILEPQADAMKILTVLSNPITINKLEKQFTSIPWKKLLDKFLAPSGYQVTQDELVVVLQPNYIYSLDELLKKTDKRVLANHVMMHFGLFLKGIMDNQNDWQKCIQKVSSKFKFIVDSQYVKKYVDQSVKNMIDDMFAKIKAEMAKILETVEWLDDETRTNALEKLVSMKLITAFADDLSDGSDVEKFYEKLEINEGDYLQNILNLTIFNTKLNCDKLRKRNDKHQLINYEEIEEMRSGFPAAYIPLRNTISISTSMLQSPFISKDLPAYMNYGAIGQVIGHEIVHAFDGIGMNNDKNGNFINWWPNHTKKNFFAKAKCMIDQYGNYEAAEVSMKVNGSLTLSENIADNGGIKLAYRAYNEWAKHNKEEKKLSSSLGSYTIRQMFWISYANIWCKEYSQSRLEYLMKTDVHTHPQVFRVLGTISNMPEFGQDFDCTSNSTMNPLNRCVVW